MKLAVANRGYEEMSNDKPVRLLICDDSVFMRMAVRALCEAHPSIEIVGEAEDGEDAIQATAELKPDVITMDLSMPGMDGVAATQAIVQKNKVSVIILSSLTERRSALAEKLMEIGAVDAIWKSASLMDIDIDGIASTILEKILFWGSHHSDIEENSEPLSALPSSKLTERIAHAAPQDTVILGTLGAGSCDSLPIVFGKIRSDSPPIILVPNVPKSCRDGFVLAVQRATDRPVIIASDGQLIEPGHIYCAFPTLELVTRRKGANLVFTGVTQANQGNDQQLITMSKSLSASNITPVFFALSGGSADACKQLANQTQDMITLVERPASCPHSEASELLIDVLSEDVALSLNDIGKTLGQL